MVAVLPRAVRPDQIQLEQVHHISARRKRFPNRDAKAAQDPEAVLKEQYDAFFHIISEERRIQEKTLSRAVYDPELGLFQLTVNKGNHFVNMGHTVKGNICLYSEEALYLVDRSSLVIQHQGVDITVQQTWSLCLSLPQNLTGPESSASTMDRYVAYAYFKRLGYAVTRPGTYDSRPIDFKRQTAATTRQLSASRDDLGEESKKDTWKQKVDFEVYKPAGAFKKRQPGIPDYRVVVVSSKENMPTLEVLSEMMEGLIDPAQDSPSLAPSDLTSTQPTDKGKKNKTPDWPKVLFAIVDGGQVSFMSLSNLQATL
ncbi:MAG: hypothetical protein J3R72DRAFT_507433 [Linnemannia gamsii]|nr:MAG: hypothetical protein J3R72DRAFT_507433 [Linnemannia gamsii]